MKEVAKLSNCPVCACSLETSNEIKLCPACDTPHHCDCWEYNEGCAIYGCTSTATPEIKTLEISNLPSKAVASPSLQVSPSRFVFQLIAEKSLLINIVKSFRILVPALILINSLIYWQSPTPMVFILCTLLTALSSFFFAFAHSLSRTQVHFRPTSGLIVKEIFFGPFLVQTIKIKFSEIKHLHVGTAIVQQGLEHREMLRLVIEYENRPKEILYLDLAEKEISKENIEPWAMLLRKETSLSILKAPPPKAGLLQKRITAFDLHLSKSENPLGELQQYWEKRWLLAIPFLMVVPFLGQTAAIMHLSAFSIVIPVIILTILYSFFRPEELYNSIKSAITGKVSYLSPEPEPLMFFDEERNIAKLSNFMTRVEESKFISLMTREESKNLTTILKIITIVPFSLLALAILTGLAGKVFTDLNVLFFISIQLLVTLLPPFMILFAMLGGAINRAVWNEEWAKGWLRTSKTALERLDEHKENEHQKLVRQENLKQLADKAVEELIETDKAAQELPAPDKKPKH